MNLIEPDDIIEFERILHGRGLQHQDFALSETDTTDPKTDEVLALQGTVTVQHKSTGKSRQYTTGDGMHWLELFSHDLQNGVFAAA